MEIENKLNSFEERLNLLETSSSLSSSSSSNSNSLNIFQSELLLKLLTIKENIENEIGDYNLIKNEKNNLLNENIQLKKEIEKLNYRINHLIKSLNEEEQKNNSK